MLTIRLTIFFGGSSATKTFCAYAKLYLADDLTILSYIFWSEEKKRKRRPKRLTDPAVASAPTSRDDASPIPGLTVEPEVILAPIWHRRFVDRKKVSVPNGI
jgi:hypothetical protein